MAFIRGIISASVKCTLVLLCCCADDSLAYGEVDARANEWRKVSHSETSPQTGAVLVFATDLEQPLLLGGMHNPPHAYVRALDMRSGRWEDISAAKPDIKKGLHPYYQTAYDPVSSKVYCFHQGTMYTLDLKSTQSAENEWVNHGQPTVLEGLSWCTVAIDQKDRQLVVVGSDKKAGNIGWTRTAIFNLDTGAWRTLPPPPTDVVNVHRDLVAARESAIDLVGGIRLAWYCDPNGTGTDARRLELTEQCERMKRLPVLAELASDFENLHKLIGDRKLLPALRLSRSIQGKIELQSEQQYPVPVSRRNSPLVWDEKNNVFVLFGGDHEDYQMNDTWVLDLGKQSWRRATPKLAPSPRAGHAFVYLPKSGKLAMYEGYVASSDTRYRGRSWEVVRPRQLWTYDVREDRWELVRSWEDTDQATTAQPSATSQFYGYSAQWFSPPPLVADEEDHLILHSTVDKKTAVSWTLKFEPGDSDASAQQQLGAAPNTRLYRTGQFLASYCEIEDSGKGTGLDRLENNKWTKLPSASRNVTYGCRQRDWSTSVWDSANDQILLWGGGHCVRSSSAIVHYSPVSGRMVEGYDADEPYGANGGGGFGSSLWNRPWMPTHGYNLYAYDPKSQLLVTAMGSQYDPKRMDWLRAEPMARPFHFHWARVVIETTPHGAVAWGQSKEGGRAGLWLFDQANGWQDLKPKGKLFIPYCDSDGIVYDSKRDRLILGWGGGYGNRGDGSITTFDFGTRQVEKISPDNSLIGQFGSTREMVYVAHADCLLFGSEPRSSDGTKSGKKLTVMYDCAKNRYRLLDAGEVAYGRGAGWMYDAKRKLVYVFTYRGDAFALKLDVDQAAVSDDAPVPK